MRIILFGADGHLGKEVASKLKQQKNEVISFTHKNCDISDLSTLKTKLKDPADIIINCAAKVPTDNNDKEQEFVNVNSNGVQNIIEFAKINDINKIIHCSTLSVIKRSWNDMTEKSNNFEKDNIYSLSKLDGEDRLRNMTCNIQYLILRLPALYGYDGNNIVNKFANLAKNNGKIVANKNFYANFMHVEDVAEYIAYLTKSRSEEVMNIAAREHYNIVDLAKQIISKTKSESVIDEIDIGDILYASVNTRKMDNAIRKYGYVKEKTLSNGLDVVLGK